MDFESLSGNTCAIKVMATPKKQIEPLVCKNSFNEYKKEAVKTHRIYLVAIAANISAIAIGTCLCWSSPMGPKLRSQDTSDSPLDRPLNTNENAWISSILTIGAFTIPFISGPCADKVGRKNVLLFTSIFFIFGYIFLLIAREVWVLLLGRLFMGFGCGFTMCVMPVYVGEISTDQTRGATNTIMSFFICILNAQLVSLIVGMCYGLCIGPYVSYERLQYLCLLIPIIFDCVFVFMPESPYYYVTKGQRSSAVKALQFLRGQSKHAVEAELSSIENWVTNTMAEKTGFFDIVKTRGNRKAFLIIFGLTFFQQLSGVGVVIYYTQTIFESAHTNLDAPIAAIIISFVELGSCAIAPVVVKNFGRKTLLLYSAVFMCITQVALGYYFYSQIVLENTNGITWLPLACLVLYYIAYSLGFGPVPWALVSEIFPQNIKAIAASINTSSTWLLGFFVAFSYPTLDLLGTYYAFWMFASFCVLAFFFVLFFVIETKDLSFANIQRKLNRSS